MKTRDVVIVGGGFAGLSLACGMAQDGHRVTVLEARTGVDPRFRGELIHPLGAEGMADVGLAQALEAAGARAVRGFAVSPGDGRGLMALPYASRGAGRPSGLAMDHVDMVAVMRKELQRQGRAELRLGQRVEGFEQRAGRAVGVRLTDGSVQRADLVLVADGRHSKLRGLMGVKETVRLLSFTVALRVRDTGLPLPEHGHVFLGAPGPTLAYEIAKDEVRMCIDVPTRFEKGRRAVGELVSRAYVPWVSEGLQGPMRSALRRDEDMELVATHAIYTDRCVVPGAALVADAGGCSHPLTASGMTNALHDIVLLRKALRDEVDLDRALLGYQARRYAFARAREVLTDALYEVFLAERRGASLMRDGILRYWRNSPRGREASMALLSADDTEVMSFAREYVAVMTHSMASLREQGGALGALPELWKLTAEKVAAAVKTLRSDWETARAQSLQAIPAEPPPKVAVTEARSASVNQGVS